ncbi:MAG: hypothetical protein GX984_02455 [Erysipelothrix sp.]|mgnify:FL=1|nr:hypothetical protein [Erysipelothrix sp.]
MLDELLISLYEVSRLLLPVLGVLVLIALSILLFKIIGIVNALPTTLTKVNDTIDTTNDSIKKLEVPLNTISGISSTVDMINKSATGIVGSVASYTMKNSDSIVNWAKGIFSKDDEYEFENEEQEEDFGVYE